MMLEEVLLGTDGSKEAIWKFWNVPNPTSGNTALDGSTAWTEWQLWAGTFGRADPNLWSCFENFLGTQGCCCQKLSSWNYNREKGKLWDIVCGKEDLSKGFTPWKIHFTFSWVRYFGKGSFTFGESLCHQWPVPGCAGASWALPAWREREKNLLFLWEVPGDSLSASRQTEFWPQKNPNPSSGTYEISNLEIHNNDKKPDNLLIIQHEVERKYQSYKNNTQSKRGKFSLPSLIPEMVLGRAPAPASRILFCNQNPPRLNEEISSSCSSSTS